MVKRDKLGRFVKGEKQWGKRPEIKKWLGKFQFKKGHKSKKPFKKGQHVSPETEFKKGIIPWSKKNKGKYHLWENRQHPAKGKPPWNKDKNHPQYKKWIEIIREIGKSNKGKLSGKKHPNFNNWSSRKPYGIEFDEELKEQIRKRDNYECQECHKKQEEFKEKLSVHHIDYNKKNNAKINLISLCKGCHMKTNYNKKHWTRYFQMQMFIKELFNPENILIFNENKQLIGLEKI